ncbi:hypothetical protein A2673_03535 [Candidatus Kaiserbacteria bacterium RIFCSPHIGHO2_01_FULL_50_13]|uniref:phenylalanine--tRNA ligase n=1 Tax=Candidatus Kaiserbacteria bacterium RIFCSPLOWO2_01_FULL_50_24 TaxID=1798507 RepID=A0A1F6EMN5_9BACT|nr:MAG: hypothetical protein A2673_03535 [Candidatus Kaiserbacteria bacterium RIFCSPHIGHO2_01_FULL_50_13]OGG74899.1 MAG: hypothetical protein A3A34_03715 [Candidatus Kaiserbacteria bacterium RIFCSPLOWO2_01_FULL_50_24]OGG81636.1 MAG: hypothetical protein A3H74_01495 [Candidatus Kaiserbacteria bacterium RIFCSPLOWO2_02_FULL_51_13]
MYGLRRTKLYCGPADVLSPCPGHVVEVVFDPRDEFCAARSRSKPTMSSEFVIPTDDEKATLKTLEKRTDPDALRIKRYLAMPDLSRTKGSPLKALVDRVKAVDTLKDFDDIKIPEVVPADVSFDLFNFPTDHPARSPSDTYYVDDENILRTHDTVMWYYYMNLPEVREKIERAEPLGVLCYGKVYRKDEIDSRHMNVFHQMGGLYMMPDKEKTLGLDDLKAVLTEIVQSIFGRDVIHRFNVDVFPYTDPSLEVEVQINGQWVEILGGGMPRREVMKNFGLTGYNSWAFGFGLERLAIIGMELPDIRLLWSTDPRVVKQLRLGQKYKEVSKYPPAMRDISFVVSNDFVPNNYFDLIRETVGDDMVEEVKLIDTYENTEKFGANKVSYAYRIVYRSREKTLTNEEVDALHKKLEDETRKQCGAEIR